jgi:hypothetical protein
MDAEHQTAVAINPVYTTSRTAKQIHDLSQVEKVMHAEDMQAWF